jgi:hypothetical protein
VATLPTRFADLPPKHQTWIVYPWPAPVAMTSSTSSVLPESRQAPERQGDYLQSLDLERRGYTVYHKARETGEAGLHTACYRIQCGMGKTGNEHADAIAETRTE